MLDPLDPYAPARDLARCLTERRISARELLERQIGRIERFNPALNAIIRLEADAARQRADALDALAAAGGVTGPLQGLALTLKDTFDVDGMPATAGAPEHANRPARLPDSAVAARLKSAGAILIGKTNTPYLAGDNQTYNPVHGLTVNPWDAARTPGGSSGGAAAALAAGLTALEVGSDLGGSLRIPAHFCGVAALKPSWGRISLLGHVPPAPGSLAPRDLNVAGPMARNSRDLAFLFRVLADTPAGGDPTARLPGLRLGVWSEEPGLPLSTQCGRAVKTAAEAAALAGARVFATRPDFPPGQLLDTYLRLLLPIVASDLSPALVRAMKFGRPIARLSPRREAFSRSKQTLYSTASHAEWLIANETRARMKATSEALFEQFDAILCPVAPGPAFTHVRRGDAVSRRLSVEGRAAPYASFHGWIAWASICHLPAVVIPVPQAAGDLPCGVQIVGREGADENVLAIAAALEDELGGFVAPPGFGEVA